MTHLIFTSVPLDEIPEPDRTSFERAVDNWGRVHSTYDEGDPSPNFVVQEIRDKKGRKRLEWRRIYGRMLRKPKLIGHCDLLSYASATTPWFALVEKVSVGTDISFRKNEMTRYDVFDGELNCWIIEEKIGNLNCLSLYFVTKVRKAIEWHTRLEMLQDRMVAFLETAAIYNLATQAIKLSYGIPSNPTTVAMCKKLTRIIRICNLEEFDHRVKRQEEEE